MTTEIPKVTEIVADVYDITVKQAPDARWRVFLFDGPTPTLVDAGFADTVDVVAAAAEELGITPERIIITHGDGDHVGGLGGLVDRFDLESWVPEAVEVEVEPDYRFGDGDEIGPFIAVSIAGHARGHHSLVDEDRGIAVIGDALFGSDTRGLPPGYFVLPTAHYSDDLGRADDELSNFLAYDFDVGLLYHGTNVTENASEKVAAFVDFGGKR
ncbi:MAG: MBL fold metallo-hydrolase [Halobellus sp.]|uniref:MBL fold metallo-hydrolase n=1 Tax=Halobellus sp. TaxID=1979212 RepID=UPI0035D4E1CF